MNTHVSTRPGNGSFVGTRCGVKGEVFYFEYHTGKTVFSARGECLHDAETAVRHVLKRRGVRIHGKL